MHALYLAIYFTISLCISLPYKDQKPANVLRKRLIDLSVKIGNAEILPVFTKSQYRKRPKVPREQARNREQPMCGL